MGKEPDLGAIGGVLAVLSTRNDTVQGSCALRARTTEGTVESDHNFLTLNGAEIHDFRHGLHTILAADEFGERVVDAAHTEHDGL